LRADTFIPEKQLGIGSLRTSLKHRLPKLRPERAAHAHTFRAPDGIDHAVDGEEARAIHGVKEVQFFFKSPPGHANLVDDCSPSVASLSIHVH
jgi:hypothetical protein